ncbi:putative inositol monophosphatase 3 [Epargyreus clarus]|uniref:putative inositol monophosphatase 3 n=1 Tax=Epargyreus clarus TaxID=520877 RepID=UPI003C2BB7A7
MDLIKTELEPTTMNFGGTLRLNKFTCLTLAFILFLIIYWQSGTTAESKPKPDVVNLKHLLRAAILASEMGGKKVVEGKNSELNVKSKGKTLEGANDPVTDADHASHCVMYNSLVNTFPSVHVESEEMSEAKCPSQGALDLGNWMPEEHSAVDYLNDEYVTGKHVTIWIDPLDATQEYTEGLYQYVTTMVCVAVRGVPVLGVIHFPFIPRTHWAWYTKATSANMPRAHHKDDHMDHPRVVVSRSHSGKVKELATNAFGANTPITLAGGAGYKVMEVINGTYDIYLHASAIKKWDICAGDAIIKSVNGKLSTLKGQNIDYTSSAHVKVTDGILVSRFDHQHYLDKLIKLET